MSARAGWMLVSGVIALVALLVVMLFLGTHRRVTTTEVLPPQGEARYNPLYVLGQALRADRQTVHSRPTLDMRAMAPAAGDTIVLLQDPGELVPAQADALLAWVERGGHLLVRTPPPGEDAQRAEPRLLAQLGVQSIGYGANCQYFDVADDPGHVEFCEGRRFGLDEDAAARTEVDWRSTAGRVMVRLARGQGSVDVLADMEFMKGRPDKGNVFERAAREREALDQPRDGLYDRAHRDLTRYLLQPNYGKGAFWLIYASRPPTLLARLLHQGWPVWVPLLLALLGWLGMRAQRFGSELPSPPEARRSLLEHVHASGILLLRRRQGPALHAAMRTVVLRRLQRRAPVAAALDGAAQHQAIAELLSWPVERVRTALADLDDHNASALGERISLLLQMRRLL